MYFKLEDISKEKFTEVARELGITSDIFADGFLVNYINGVILSNEILNAKESYEKRRAFLIETFVCYIRKIDKKIDLKGEF